MLFNKRLSAMIANHHRELERIRKHPVVVNERAVDTLTSDIRCLAAEPFASLGDGRRRLEVVPALTVPVPIKGRLHEGLVTCELAGPVRWGTTPSVQGPVPVHATADRPNRPPR